jgi:hypothetical protein
MTIYKTRNLWRVVLRYRSHDIIVTNISRLIAIQYALGIAASYDILEGRK